MSPQAIPMPSSHCQPGVASSVCDMPAAPSKHSFKSLVGPDRDAAPFLRQAARDAREGRKVMQRAVNAPGVGVACAQEVWVAVFGGLGAWSAL